MEITKHILKNYKDILRHLFLLIAILCLLVISFLLTLVMGAFLSIDIRLYGIQLLQLFLLAVLVLLYLPVRIWPGFVFIWPLFFVFLIIEFYYLQTLTLINFGFFIRNINDFFLIAGQTPFWILTAVIAAFLLFAGIRAIVKYLRYFKLKRPVLALSIVVFLMISFLMLDKRDNNHLFYFLSDIFFHDKVLNSYQDHYRSLINGSIAAKNSFNPRTALWDQSLNNIVFLQLESVNREMASQNITPNLFALSQEGIYFENFYANSTQTIFAQENILCGLPSSFFLNLVQTGDDKKVLCLPYVLSRLGYRTVFAKTYDLGFTKTGKFMRNIGFDEVLADGLMQENDPRYQWGYREDVFYKRFFDYYDAKKQDRNFIFLEVGPTNHWPFNAPDDIEKSVQSSLPFPKPATFKERISNTTYIQDYYLGAALKGIKEMFPAGDYVLFILSDHAWPYGLHSGNTFNQKLSYQENFEIPLIVKFGTSTKMQAARQIKNPYSLVDIMPSILDMYGQSGGSHLIGRSFLPKIENAGAANNDQPVLMIQPYSRQYINVLLGMDKYQYIVEEGGFFKYDLANDPLENNPILISNDAKTVNHWFADNYWDL